MILTPEQLAAITGQPVNANARSVLASLDRAGVDAGLDRPHRLAHFLSQVAHESAGFRYDKEIWNPDQVPAQARYDTRTDLGNTPERDGDGFLYRGRGPIQVTGKSNYSQLTAWARERFPDAPDFVDAPDEVLVDPWEGISAIWYWDTRSLNRYADKNDAENLTRRINGGLNGYQDRLRWYTRAALVLAGFDADDVREFQRSAGIAVDGVAGPITRGSLHKALQETKADPLVLPGAAGRVVSKLPLVQALETAKVAPVAPDPMQVPKPADVTPKAPPAEITALNPIGAKSFWYALLTVALVLLGQFQFDLCVLGGLEAGCEHEDLIDRMLVTWGPLLGVAGVLWERRSPTRRLSFLGPLR